MDSYEVLIQKTLWLESAHITLTLYFTMPQNSSRNRSEPSQNRSSPQVICKSSHGIHDRVELIEMEKELHASCGAYCGVCEFYTKKKNPHCPGCVSENGHLFWGECQLFACAKKHSVNHCGECPEFPCDLFVNQFDPAEGPKSAFMRAGLLAYRKKAGTDKYLEAVEKLDQSKEEKSR